MSASKSWAECIEYVRDAEGVPTIDTIVRHIRAAVVESGFVTRSRLTSGLKEAYRPFGVEPVKLRDQIEEALRILLLTGDVDMFSTSAGRAYTATSPRYINWAGSQVAILGGVVLEKAGHLVRRLTLNEARKLPAAEISLVEELGRPAWRTALVDFGSADAFGDNPRALFGYASALAAGGDRFTLEPVDAIAVLSGRGDFFGQSEPTLSGRWSRAGGDGVFPGVVRTGYETRNVLLRLENGAATIWNPPSRDIWQWIVIGMTLAQGDEVMRFDPATELLTFLTPPPRQLERAVLLTGTRQAAWTWRVDANVFAIIATILGRVNSATQAIASRF